MKTRNHLLALGILLALSLVGRAQSVIYSDSFESGNTTGWSDTVVSPGGAGYAEATIPESYWAGYYGAFNGQAGSYFAILNLQGNSTSPTAASNNFSNANVGSTFAANTTYILTYLAAGSGDSGYPSGGTISTSFEAGGAVIGSATAVAAQQNSTDAFATYTVTFDTASNPGVVGQAIGIDTLYSNSAIEYQQFTAVDNYQITATPDVAPPPPGGSVVYSDSFESPGDTDQNDPVGWTVVGSGNDNGAFSHVETGTDTYNGGPYSNLNGTQAAFLYLAGLDGSGATSQGLDFYNASVGSTFAAATTYTLTYLDALPSVGTGGDGPVAVSLMAGGAVIGSSTQTVETGSGSDVFASSPVVTIDTAANPGLVGQNIGIDVNWSPYTGLYSRNIGFDDFQITANPDAATRSAGMSTMGINLIGDWLWADAMRMARPQWNTFAAPYAIPGTATVDGNNWPTEDALMVVWEGHGYNDGTYALSFNGKATIADLSGFSTVLPSSTGTYNAATNTTTATLVITDTGEENFELGFSNTQRTSSSATNTGITNVHLYRPVSEGSTTTYAPGTLFTNQALAVGEKFSTVRFMWLSEVIDSLQTNWSDRNPPTNWYQGQGGSSPGSANTPMSYEYMVAYCNATNTDLYLNIPIYATDTYVTDLANLVKYGSDGANPYTSVQTSPVYPPLNSSLHVYLEYSNEIWNGSYAEHLQNYDIVVADQTANNAEWSILNYDGAAASNLWDGADRRVGLRALEISNDFRAVFGNAAMPPNANATVRPLLECQAENGNQSGSTGLQFLDDYYNDSDGVSHVATPEPVNYFLWGGGGATYYGSNDDTATTLDAFFASGIPNTVNTPANDSYPGEVQTDAAVFKAYGIKRVAYEGGWFPDNGTNGYENLAGSPAELAKYDPRAATAEESAQTIFQQSGGDLNMFFQSSDWDPNFIFGMTDAIFDLTTPLYEAVDSIATSTPAAITYGNPISGTAATTLTYAPQGTQGSPGSQLFALNTYWYTVPDNGVLGWVPLISTAGNYQISININSATAGGYVRVLVDGQTIGGGAISVPVSGSAQNVVLATVNLTAGQHGLLLEGQYASNNSYSGNSCTFTSVVFTPEP